MQSGGNEIFCGKDVQLKETVSRICCCFFSHHPNLACRRELNSEHITDKPAYFLQSYLLDMYHILKTSFEFRSFVKVLCKKKVPVNFHEPCSYEGEKNHVWCYSATNYQCHGFPFFLVSQVNICITCSAPAVFNYWSEQKEMLKAFKGIAALGSLSHNVKR